MIFTQQNREREGGGDLYIKRTWAELNLVISHRQHLQSHYMFYIWQRKAPQNAGFGLEAVKEKRKKMWNGMKMLHWWSPALRADGVAQNTAGHRGRVSLLYFLFLLPLQHLAHRLCPITSPYFTAKVLSFLFLVFPCKLKFFFPTSSFCLFYVFFALFF